MSISKGVRWFHEKIVCFFMPILLILLSSCTIFRNQADTTAVLESSEHIQFNEPLIMEAVYTELSKGPNTPLAISDLKTVKELYICYDADAGTPQITSLQDMAKIYNLEVLTLDGCDVESADGLGILANLRDLRILRSSKLNDISAIGSLQQLQSLMLYRNGNLKSIDTLSALTHLSRLDITYTAVQDIQCVESMPNLTYFSAMYSDITDCTPLKACHNLITINLKGTYIEDITPLQELRNLKELYLRETSIVNLAPLYDMYHLERLDLFDSAIYYEDNGEQQYQELKKRLPNCEIIWGGYDD